MKLLDLFCGAGGAAMGYHRAGFEVVGVDHKPQPNYPFRFVQADAMSWPLDGYDAIHASPPCQAYTTLRRNDREYPDLYACIRDRLEDTGVPWVVENVPWVVENVIGAPYGWGFVLCGSMFDLKVRRHRNFESSHLLFPPQCRHKEQGRPWTITGSGGAHDGKHSLKPAPKDFWRYLDMPWMEGQPPYGVAQAIPPAYTEWIGTRLREQLLQQAREAAAEAMNPRDKGPHKWHKSFVYGRSSQPPRCKTHQEEACVLCNTTTR